jgi:hypothetical protein
MKSKPHCVQICLMALALLALPAAVQAQFDYFNNGNGTITITGYTGTSQTVSVPAAINGLPVTGIASGAFISRTIVIVTDITIGNGVTNIWDYAFESDFWLIS